jgi:conjugative transposon TraN protein
MFNFFHTSVFKLILLLACAFFSRIAFGQAPESVEPAYSVVQNHDMVITYNKTSSIVFSSQIKSIDRGSRDILARKAPEVGNVLQLKANRENFPETNLTVITADGVLHNFVLNYVKNPDALCLELNTQGIVTRKEHQSAIVFHSEMTEPDLEQCAADIIEADKVITLKHEREYKIGLFLKGIYIKDNVMFFHFGMNNTSNINYDVDFLRFYIADQEKVKRTASQEIGVKPIYVHGNDKLIPANSNQDVIYALNKFTIPDAKNLVIEMFEKNGGRHLNLSIRNRMIVNARLLP